MAEPTRHVNHSHGETPGKRLQPKVRSSSLLGRWRITDMSEFDTGERAHILIKTDGTGSFRFGQTRSDVLEGEFKRIPTGTLFVFTWEGSEDGDRAWGSGWMRMKDARTAEGEIRFYGRDVSRFRAQRRETKAGKRGTR